MPVIPPPGATLSTFQVGTYNALTDAFTLVQDLNDFSATYVHWNSIKFTPPDEIDVRGNNMRTPGERISRIQYKNGHLICAVMVRATTPQLVVNKIHAIRQAVRNENLPYVIRFAFPGASNYTYLDVAKCVWTPPYDPQEYNANFQTNIVLDFEVAPGMRGDRLTLQNYCVNPGFEQQCGGPNAPAVQVFSDNFANVNAYAVQAGGAPTLNPANTYVDVVAAGGPIARLLPLSEASGTIAYDIEGGGNNGTSSNCTLGATGLISGDTSTCYTLNGTTSKVTVPVTGLPTGNNKVTLQVVVQFASNPAANTIAIAYGNSGSALAALDLGITSLGKPFADCGTGASQITGGSALTTAHTHTLAVTWDGTNLLLFADGSQVASSTPGTLAIPASPGLMIGASTGSSNFWAGQLAMAAVFSTNIGSSALSTMATAATSGATGTVAGAMTIPASGRVAFGSPAWGAVQTWQTRFRFTSGSEWRWILHLMDTSNFLYARVRGTGIELHHTIAGTDHLLATQALTLVHEAWYWIQVTQFPTPSANSPFVQATVFYDTAGAPSSVQVAMVGPSQTFDGVTALIGRPQLQSIGGALTIGGTNASVHTVSLFGPGGWYVQQDPATYSPSSAAWDQNASNTIPIGTSALVPVSSLGAARVDCPPAGTVSCYWLSANTSSLANLQATGAIPTTNGVQFSASCYVKSSGMGANCSLQLNVWEYTSAGAFVAEKLVQSATGNQAAWTQLTGTITTDATTAFVLIALRVQDTNTGQSANGIVWFENVQLWLTANGASMPYCELRFMTSPAQLVVSGLLGDMPSACHLSLGAYLPNASWTNATTVQYLLGQRATPTPAPTLYGKYPAIFAGTTPVLSAANAFGGWYMGIASSGGINFYPDAFAGVGGVTMPVETNFVGTYHWFMRLLSGESAGNLPKVSIQTLVLENPAGLQGPATVGPILTPLTTSNIFNLVDLGQIVLPVSPAGNLHDVSQVPFQGSASLSDSAGSAAIQGDWWALIPVDGPLVSAAMNLPGPSSWNASWLWMYFDGLARQQSKTSALQFGLGGTTGLPGSSVPLPALGMGGTFGPTRQSPVSGASPYLVLDPTQSVNGVAGINEFVGVVADTNQGAWPGPLPLVAEFLYSPLYNYPR